LQPQRVRFRFTRRVRRQFFTLSSLTHCIGEIIMIQGMEKSASIWEMRVGT
jgi:hypothetical protein